MREMKVESTKASYDRLFLMRDPDGLPLPLDREKIAPFGVRVVDRDNRRRFELLFRDQIVGVALGHEGDGFRARLTKRGDADSLTLLSALGGAAE